MDGAVVSEDVLQPRIVSLADARDEAIAAAVGALRAGEVIVLPTDTVYGVAADAFMRAATGRIFDVKGRPRSLPLPVLVSRPRQAWALASSVPEGAEGLAAAFWPGALTLILPQAAGLEWDLGDGDGTVALRMPNHADLIQILETVGPLAATSANLTGEPTPPTVEGVRDRLEDAVRLYLDGGPSPSDTGSTIVDLARGAPRLVREGPIPAAEVERVLGAPIARA